MSTAADHYDQARRNRAFAEQLLSQHASDVTSVQWAVTAAFYVAVHCMQGHLMTLGLDPQNHAERGYLIAQPSSGVPFNVRWSYRWLKQRSESARYRLGVFAPAFVQREVFDVHLANVTTFVGL